MDRYNKGFVTAKIVKHGGEGSHSRPLHTAISFKDKAGKQAITSLRKTASNLSPTGEGDHWGTPNTVVTVEASQMAVGVEMLRAAK
ncbi:hypothetical protein [Ruegeria atlantica]|uniref:hypothetical protein n=1 Tax=Ruegeria atlantica TaxID=81569 RepID=UPI00148063C6|nr:hypothetical protein [Ruegeria atlantica]